jgi:type II secretory pathway component GspD/PulD (secretin)
MRTLRYSIALFSFAFFLVAGDSCMSQERDIATLVHPEVADRLSLDDEQRVKIQRFIQQRGEALVAAQDDAAKAVVRQDFRTKVTAVLTEQQLAEFTSEPEIQKLMFQFRNIQWEDVLSWFAQQQDLTLVMDRIPPGTFSYSDTRTYTPAEGIDLLNSVLMTRGFTLVRRQKMLVVMELSNTLPLELIPRVELANLVERGRFELVSVVFQLSGRPYDAVLQEVKPYLSTFGRVIPLARNSQLLVIDTAGKMATINELIASVPVPKRPEPQAKPAPPPKPIFAAYPLNPLDPSSVLETVKKLVPSEQITVDAKTGVLSAFVIPDQQTAIKSAIDEMLASRNALAPVQSVAYGYAGMQPEQIKLQIKELLPLASVAVTADRVLISAPGDMLPEIKAAMDALNLEPVEGSTLLRSFVLPQRNAAELTAALQAFLPGSQVASNASAGTLIVRGSAEDLASAEEILEIWRASESTSQMQLRAFPLGRIATPAWLVTVAKIVPDAKTWLNDDGQSLMMLAMASDVELVESMLPQLLSVLPEPAQRTLKIYSLSKSQQLRKSSLMAELPDDLADIKMVDGSEPSEILVWAEADQHAKFSTLLESIDQPLPTSEAKLPKTYPLQVADTALVTRILTSEFPEAEISVNTSGDELTVIAVVEVQTQIGESVDVFNAQLPARPLERLESYSLRSLSPAELQAALAPVLGDAKVSIDASQNRLLIWSDAQTHQEISDLVQTLGEEPAIDQQKVVMAYSLENIDATNAKTVIDQIAGDATILADVNLQQLVVTANLQTQAVVKSTLTQIDRASMASNQAELRSYDTRDLAASTLLAPLQAMWPTAKITVDVAANKLLVTATAREHEALNQALEQLLTAPEGQEQQVQTYSVPAGEMRTLPAILGQLAPRAIISSDAVSRTVTVWASPSQQKRVQQAIEQIAKTAQSSKTPATYTIKPSQVIATQASLRALFPTVSIAADAVSGQLIVVATEEEQARISEVMTLLTDGPNSSEKTTRVFRFDPEEVSVTDLLAALRQTAPERVSLQANLSNHSILAIGLPEEMEQVAAQIEDLKTQVPPPEKPKSVIYRFNNSDPNAAARIIATLTPKAILAIDPATQSIAAMALTEDHAKIAEFAAAFDTLETEQTVETYSVPAGEMRTLPTVLTGLAPGAVFSTDILSRTVTVWASAAQHQRIAATIEQIANAAQSNRSVANYSVNPSQLVVVQTSLRTLFPSAQLSADPATGQLIVVAPETVQTRVADVLQMMTDGPNAADKTTRVFAFDPESVAVTELYTALQQIAPERVFVQPNSVNNSLLAVGVPEDLDRVAKQIEDLQEQMPAIEQKTSSVYQLQHTDSSAAMTILATLVPRATLAEDRRSETIAATATEEDQLKIADFIEAYDLPEQSDLITQVYRLQQGSARGLSYVLSELFPDATIYGDRETGTLVATASEEQHRRIDAIVQDYDGGEIGQETRVFSLSRGDARSLESAIEDLAVNASVTGDSQSNSLVVTAKPEDMERIAEVIEQIEQGGASSTITKFYTLKSSDSRALSTALTESFPSAKITADPLTGGIYAAASPEDHLKIEEVVKNVNEQPNLSRQLKAFVLRSSSPRMVADAIDDAFGRRSSAGVSFDQESRTVFVVGTEDQLLLAEQLVEQIDQPASPEDARQLRAFSLRGVDGSSVTQAVESLFEEDASMVDVQYDTANEQLLVTAEATQLKLVEETLLQFTPPERKLRIVRLDRIDPYTFQSAVDSLFEDEPEFQKPQLTVDYSEQQVLVRATTEQLLQIDDLISQLGEPSSGRFSTSPDGQPGTPTASSRLRFVPVSRNPQRMFKELQRLWPTIRTNPLKIVDPKSLLEGEPNDDLPSSDAASPKGANPVEKNPAGKGPLGGGPAGGGNAEEDISQAEVPPNGSEFIFVTSNQATAAQIESTGQASAPPIIVVTGEEQWTLASDDIEALDQLEELLAAMLDTSIAPFATTGNYSIYVLRHAGAEEMEDLLSDLFGTRSRGNRSSFLDSLQRLRFVADSRTNTLIMSGGRSDRAVVEELLGVLDSEDFIDTLQQISPTLIPLENASAENILEIVQDVYRSQLSAGAGRQPVAIPEGVSTEVATVLQQINAQTSGALLTLAIDENTNSIVMRAPNELSQELQAFIERLDQQAKTSLSQRVELIRLKSTNADNLQRALRLLMAR